ncbi:MAG: sulfatase-like hydrolase/transferase, partial [Planctomycetes bacterium]|nr:sulfatase-like hydrolase/transferase [Planctomycetota bacterium]
DVATLNTDPTEVTVFPYHQDTALSRYTAARYHDRQSVVDAAIGKIIDRLKKGGLYENTIIFYFGDHGGVLPRSKGYLYESGLHVPLVIRVPTKYQSMNPWNPGVRVDGFVSFIDFAPTVLNLAGVKIPNTMDGTPFLGGGVDSAAIDKQDEAFGYADRFDEKYELVRSFRKGNFKYIRNYENFYPDSLQNNYRYRMLSFREWREHYNQGKLNEAQSHFFKAKPVESLYDISKDPYEIHNLASDPLHRETLMQLRKALQTQVKKIHDLSFYPESQMIEYALADGARFGEDHEVEINSLVDAVDLALLPFAEATTKIAKGLKSKNPRMRYWTLTACTSFAKKAERFTNTAKELLHDKDDLVRLRAAEFLAIIGHNDPQSTIYDILANNPSGTVAAITLNTVVFLRDHHNYEFRLDSSKIKGSHEPLVQRRLEYLNQ